MESQRCLLKASFQIWYHQIWPSWLYYIWPLKCAAVNIWQPPQTENVSVQEGGSPAQVLEVPSFPSNNVFVFVFVFLCKKRLECATRLSSSGLPSLGDPCRPRWERGPCRSLVELVVPAVPHNQPNKSHQRGLGGRRGIFGLTSFWSQRLSLEDVTARDLNRVAKQLLCSHRSHQVGRVTQVARLYCFLFF